MGDKVMSYKFTEDDITSCWGHYLEYLAEILNEEYPLEKAREDLLSLVGSEFDERIKLKS